MKTRKNNILMAICLFCASVASVQAGGTETLNDRLRGSVSGVRVNSLDGSPEGLYNINIRGVNSIRTSSAPLVVLDGVYMNASGDGNLNSFWKPGEGFRLSPHDPMLYLNMNDIKSIEVLKNISQTAAYGSEGANGVIVITTRNSESEDLKVNWNSGVSLTAPSGKADVFGLSVGHAHDLSVSISRGGAEILSLRLV